MHFKYRDEDKWKVNEEKNICHANGKRKKSRVTILLSDKIVKQAL